MPKKPHHCDHARWSLVCGCVCCVGLLPVFSCMCVAFSCVCCFQAILHVDMLFCDELSLSWINNRCAYPPFETKLKNNHKVTVHFLSFFVCGLRHRRRRTRSSAPAVAPVWGDHPSASHKSTPLTQVGLPVSFLLLFFRCLTFEKRL